MQSLTAADHLAEEWLRRMAAVGWSAAVAALGRRKPCGETTQLEDGGSLFDVSDSWEWTDGEGSDIRLTVEVFMPGASEAVATRKCIITRGGIRTEALIGVDGKKRWKVVQRPDGFFFHSEESLLTEDESQFGGGIYEYWSPTYDSGLFDTAEAAKADAMRQFPWLQNAIPSN